MSDGDRKRFHNLLRLAADSPYEGERSNALEAARRLAAKYDQTLEEAAELGLAVAANREEMPKSSFHARSGQGGDSVARFGQSLHLMDYYLHVDKQRREAAMAEARARGLDEGQNQAPAALRSPTVKRKRQSRMNPRRHAAVLLRETSLPIEEVADITGLNIYEIVGLKLKLRRAA